MFSQERLISQNSIFYICLHSGITLNQGHLYHHFKINKPPTFIWSYSATPYERKLGK